MKITKEIWKELLKILNKHKIQYTSHITELKGDMEYSDKTIHNKHIQINLVIPDYFEEGSDHNG